MKRQWLGVWAVVFLGLIFVVAGAGKIFAQSGGTELLLPEFLPPSLVQAVSVALPWVEITVGVLLILGIAVKFTTSLSALMIAGFVTSNIILINLGMASEPCGCFGGITGGEFSTGSALMLDGVMVMMVLLVFKFHPSSFRSIRPWCLVTEGKTTGDMVVLEEGGLSNEQSP